MTTSTFTVRALIVYTLTLSGITFTALALR